MERISVFCRKNGRYIWTGIVLLYLGFIYHNSLTPAVESAQQSGTVLLMLQTALDRMGFDSSWLTDHIVRKTAHFAEFALLGLLLWNCLRSWRLTMPLRVAAEAFLSLFLPFFDETLQLFTEGRSAQVDDVWLDVAGVCFGTLFMVIVAALVRRLRGRARGGQSGKGESEHDGFSG